MLTDDQVRHVRDTASRGGRVPHYTTVREIADELLKARARIAELCEALKPFAEESHAQSLEAGVASSARHDHIWNYQEAEVFGDVKVGDFERAESAISKTGGSNAD